MPHRRRSVLTDQTPVHVTLRLVDGIPSLRTRRGYQLAQRAMLLANRFEDVRVCHLSIQRNHLHLIIEADNERALTRVMRSFQISFSKNLNREFGRGKAQVFADRYHVERLETPTQVRAALAYVLAGRDTGTPDVIRFADLPFPEDGALPIRFPTSRLLRDGWRKLGLISPWSKPGTRTGKRRS